MRVSSLCIVVIGRNESARLCRVLGSAMRSGYPVVYVDSGSSDDSVAIATKTGIAVHELDPRHAFSAARARNEGAGFANRHYPGAQFLQFVDGDSILSDEWIDHALEFMRDRPAVGIVFGRLQELNPGGSLYNRLCDYEWNPAEPGEVGHCGGNMFIRQELFEKVGGFRADIIDSEDNELGIRVRKAGATVWFIDHLMALHDAGMTHFGQWWTRMYRNGHGLGQLADMHWRSEPTRLIRAAKVIFWGLVLPVAVLIGTYLFGSGALLLLILYPVQGLRTFLGTDRKQTDLLYAGFSTLAKIPMSLGIAKYVWGALVKTQARIIEYK